MTPIEDSRMRTLLVRAMQGGQTTRIRNILAEFKQLACRVCKESNVSVHPEAGWGVTVLCERQECQGAHTVLL
ncbi:hypothetical protein GCM10009753_44630 [Streptantibioticus ferralitis]